MPTHFKLRFDDFTRRTSFSNRPSWKDLSTKISALYSIPQEHVGVTYTDPEDEEITLSTEEELQDYYDSSYLPGEPIKFTVRSLASINRRFSSSNVRNTFGQFVDLDDVPGVDDWQSVNNIPPLDEILGLSSPASHVRSAFVESVSEGSTVRNADPGDLLDRDNGDVASQVSGLRIPSEDKGKGRADSHLSLLSTQSVLAEDDGDKHPVHVYDVSSQKRSSAAPPFSLDQTSAPIVAESTPRAQPQSLDNDKPLGPGIEKQPSQEPKSEEFDDPPLATFDSAPQSAPPSASFARDIASFLNMITNIISSHPEISEALRNIARNTTSGTYWTVHRAALSQAAAEFQRSTEALADEGRRAMEADAGRRVAEALAGVLRIFSQAQPTAQPPAQPPSTPNHSTDTRTYDPSDRLQTPPIPGEFPGFHPALGRNFSLNHGHAWQTSSLVPPNLTTNWWAMPPRPSPLGSGALNATGIPSASPALPPRNVSLAPAGPDPAHAPQPTEPNAGASTDNQTSEEPLSLQEMKTKVDEAHKAYKVEKERYRQQREERRKRERTLTKGDTLNISQTPDIANSAETAHIVSNARNGFPQFEMVNVSGTLPQRHNTHLGHFPRRHEKSGGDLFTRAVNRISRRLSDMGFTEQAYPDLPDTIRAELPSDGAVTKDREDDIVTTLLERMLAAPKTPGASGPGLKDIPGGWH